MSFGSRVGLLVFVGFALAGACGGDGAGEVPGVDGGAGSDGGAFEPDASVPPDGGVAGRDLFVSPAGDDGSAGTEAEPLRTIAYAASIAEAGDTIVLLDGTFGEDTQPSFASGAPTVIPAGVDLRAARPAGATLIGSVARPGLALAGSGSVRDVVFSGFGPAITASSGEVVLASLAFGGEANADAPVLVFGGTVRATVTVTAGTPLWSGDGRLTILRAEDEAEVRVEGGSVEDTTRGSGNGAGLFHALDDASIELVNVVVRRTPIAAVFAEGNARIAATGAVFEAIVSPALAVIELRGASAVELTDTRILDPYWAAISTLGSNTVTLDGGEITGSGSWALIVNAPGPTTLDVSGTTITGAGTTAIELRAPGSITIDGATISDSLGAGVATGSAVVTLELRGTTVEGNMQGGVRLNAATGSSFDLGTRASPGGNTLLGAAGAPAVVVQTAGEVPDTFAVGNTWTPGVQGADAEGRYTATGAGAVFEVTGPVAPGANHQVVNTGARLRLAENP